MQQGHIQLADPCSCKMSVSQSYADPDAGNSKFASVCLLFESLNLIFESLIWNLSLVSFFICCQLCLDSSSLKCLERYTQKKIKSRNLIWNKFLLKRHHKESWRPSKRPLWGWFRRQAAELIYFMMASEEDRINMQSRSKVDGWLKFMREDM